jgi:hypothetical protein
LADKKLMGANGFVGLLPGVAGNFAMKNGQSMQDAIKGGRTDRSVRGGKSSGKKEGRSRNVGGYGKLFL